MKKKVLLSSAALLASVTLAACGNNSNNTSKADSTTKAESKEKTTLKLAALESGYGSEMWPAIIKAYEEANPNVKVELTQDKEIEDKITPQMKAGDYPDIVNACIRT